MLRTALSHLGLSSCRSLRVFPSLEWCMVSALHSLMLLSPWLIGGGGQSTPGTVASLSSHRKDLREKHVSEDSEGSGFCFRRRLKPCPKDARTARRRKSTKLLLVFKFSLLHSLHQLRIRIQLYNSNNLNFLSCHCSSLEWNVTVMSQPHFLADSFI